MLTQEHREELQEALKSSINRKRTREEAVAALKRIGILTQDGKPSPNYYPAQSDS